MNALALILIINALILQHWRRRTGLRAWMDLIESVLQRVEARTYTLADMRADPRLQVFQQLLQTGRLAPGRIRSLLTWIRRLEQEDAARLRLGYGSAFRLGLGACVGLAAALCLEGSWMLRLSENPPAILLMVGESLIIFVWLHRLKAHPLADSLELQAAFTAAWLGQSAGGPWHAGWQELAQKAQASGRDRTQDQERLLEDWILEGERDQEKRMIWSEELFGLVELAGSVYFLGTACALPLLKQWGTWD